MFSFRHTREAANKKEKRFRTSVVTSSVSLRFHINFYLDGTERKAIKVRESPVSKAMWGILFQDLKHLADAQPVSEVSSW
jgi:hypothetical protein